MSIYNSIPAPKLSRNNFNFSHRNNFSFNFHKLYPVLLREVLPGDKHRQGTEQFIRFAPMVAPVLSQIKFSQQAFFVPMRTISDHWEDFITGGRQGTYDKVLPYTTLGSLKSLISSRFTYISTYLSSEEITLSDAMHLSQKVLDSLELIDFMGIPFEVIEPPMGLFDSSSAEDFLSLFSGFVSSWNTANVGFSNSDIVVNLAPFYAFQKVYDEYYRDQNLEDSVLDLIDKVLEYNRSEGTTFSNLVGYVSASTFDSLEEAGIDAFDTIFSGRKRAWQKDRFTAALPFTQRGPEVLIPIGGTAPVTTQVNYSGTIHPSESNEFGNNQIVLDGGKVSEKVVTGSPSLHPSVDRFVDFDDADLTTTINEFRRAERLQRWYENSARGGARLNENTLSHWGVHTPDATLDRAEFLGGASSPVVISEIPQTSSTDDTSPQGTLAGKATGYNSGYLYSRYFSEHGIVIVICSCMVQPTYQQGIDRIYTRQSRFDYAWPEFANLGEEPVFTKELYALAGNDKVFGYLPRYYDYKSAVSETHGQFKSSLNFWHMSRIFDNEPQLNKDFIMSTPRLNSFAVTDPGIEHIYCTMIFHERISRLLPYYGVPTI